MNDLKATQNFSTAIGDYLKAIWQLVGSGVASTSDVSEQLSVAPASVTRMLGRLQEMGFVRYERYRGASLTEEGRTEALRLLRRHRLIETFLLEHLGYSWQEVHDEAERLEHAVSDGFTERLANFLGHPEHDPHGDPIPSVDGTLGLEDSRPLSEVETDECVRISRVAHKDTDMLAYLEERKLVPGRWLEIREVRALDSVVTVEDEEGRSYPLGKPLAQSIFVEVVPEERDE